MDIIKLKPRITVCKPPTRTPIIADDVNVFLAGSIEQGQAVDWQTKITNKIQTVFKNKNINIFNPRRDDWDSSWKQSIDNPQFKEQVTWELDHLDKSDVIALYFDGDTKSPITLLELGLHANRGENVIIFCPDNFWRKGNVEMVADYYGLQLFSNEDDWMNAVVDRILDLRLM